MMENKKGNEKSTSMLIAFMVFNTHFYIFREHFRWIGLCIKVFAHTHKKQQSSSKLFPTRKKQQTEERMNQNKMQAEKKRTATIQRRVASGSFIRICASCVFIASTSQWYQLSSHYNVRMHKKNVCVVFSSVWFCLICCCCWSGNNYRKQKHKQSTHTNSNDNINKEYKMDSTI